MGLFDLLSGAIGGVGSLLGGQAQQNAINSAIPKPLSYSLSPSGAQQQFTQQGQLLPQVATLLQNAANLDNSAYQQGVFALDPALQGNIAGVDTLANQFARGYVDPQTQAAIQRQTAYNALQGGYAESGMADAAQRVAVARQAQTEQNESPQLQGEAMNQSLALNPTHVDVGSTLLSPAAILQRQDAQDAYNNQQRNQFAAANAALAAKAGGSSLGGIFGGAGGILSGLGKILGTGGGVFG